MALARSVPAAGAAVLVLVALVLAWRGLAPDTAVPAVSYTLLDGRKGSTESLRGKVLLVNFWATSCATCVAEMPQIVAMHDMFGARGYETLAVAMSHDPPAYVARFAETHRLPFGVAIDNTGEIAKRFGDVEFTPTTFVIDRRGAIVERYVGTPDFAALHALLEKLLAQT
jgi:peroxiredoxin